jgi:hypothetical protein
MRPRTGIAAFLTALSAAGVLAAASAAGASTGHPAAHPSPGRLVPGDLLVSGTIYQDPGIVAGQTQLPPGCTGSNCVTAVADGTYPQVFNNASADASFGVTSKIFLDELTPGGRAAGRIMLNPNNIVTSYSSKSELALNLSADGKYVTFMGYAAKPGTVDVSNANTPGEADPQNPIPTPYYREVGQIDAAGNLSVTKTNAYTSDNGRAAIAATVGGKEYYYTAGNASSVATPQLPGTIIGTGAQLITPSREPAAGQAPGAPTPVGSFSVTQLGDKQDKIGKDDNFRGLTIFDNVLYYTKGSGSNGVNTVYFVDTTGKACPNGVGLPQPGAKLPSSPLAYDASALQTTGLPGNMCILKGFPTALAKGATDASDYPFGIFFANADTLYVADEGAGDNTYANGTYTAAAASTSAGLQKWVFDKATGQWNLAYTLQDGLNLGTPYTVPGYPTGNNAATGLPWAPATDGLRNIAGRVNPDGTVSIWAVTSTVSGSGDQGADPDKLVEITDPLNAAAPASWERFAAVIQAKSGQLLRGVSLTPGSRAGA